MIHTLTGQLNLAHLLHKGRRFVLDIFPYEYIDGLVEEWSDDPEGYKNSDYYFILKNGMPGLQL